MSLRVCFLSKMFPPFAGGSGLYAYEMANALGARGHDVDVYTQATDDEGDDRSVHTHDNVTVYTVTAARRYLVTVETLYYSLRARQAVDFEDYDVIHGTLMPASTIALSDRLGIETPLVVTSHGTSLGEARSHAPELPSDYLLKYVFHPTNVVFDTIAGHAADHVIAISSDSRDELAATYRVDPQNLSLILHGVDTERYRPREGSHPAVSSDELTLLFVGRLVSRKGVSTVIEAMAELNRSDVELLIAGTGRHDERLRGIARTLGVTDDVTFLGYVPDEDLPTLYSATDVFLFPSRYEGFGLVFLEALASGTPVIGTPVGGVPDIVEDGETGYVVPHDPAAFAEKITYLADNPDILDAMSHAARAEAEDRTWDHVAGQVEEVYRRVLDDT
jgi:glycosyltransferase involved in cell wall biosynthesis